MELVKGFLMIPLQSKKIKMEDFSFNFGIIIDAI